MRKTYILFILFLFIFTDGLKAQIESNTEEIKIAKTLFNSIEEYINDVFLKLNKNEAYSIDLTAEHHKILAYVYKKIDEFFDENIRKHTIKLLNEKQIHYTKMAQQMESQKFKDKASLIGSAKMGINKIADELNAYNKGSRINNLKVVPSDEIPKGCKVLISLYHESFRTGDFDFAFQNWMIAYSKCQPKLLAFFLEGKTLLERQINEEGEKPEYLNILSDLNEKIKNDKTISDNLEVPFAIIEEVPTYPGCTGGNAQKKECLSKKIQKVITKNFNNNLPNELGLSAGKKRIFVTFKISSEGKVIDITAKAPHPKLKAEAIRIMKLIPQLVPGRQRGKVVTVTYSLPIVFKVSE